MSGIPDVMKAAASAYKMLLDNDAVRVMQVQLKPGQTAPMHDHPSNHVVYVNKDAKLKLKTPDGKEQVFDLKAGQTVWMDKGPHETTNVGTSDADNLVVEVKK